MFDTKTLEHLVNAELREAALFGLSHIERAKKNFDSIKEELKFDEEVASLSLMLHCVGARQWIQFNQDLTATSVNLTKRFLTQANYPSKNFDQIIHCVQESGLSGKPKTIEAMLVHDANMLDEIGAIGILKDSVLFVKQRKTQEQFLDCLRAKSFHLNETFFTEKGRELSEEGIEYYVSFVKILQKEL